MSARASVPTRTRPSGGTGRAWPATLPGCVGRCSPACRRAGASHMVVPGRVRHARISANRSRACESADARVPRHGVRAARGPKPRPGARSPMGAGSGASRADGPAAGPDVLRRGPSAGRRLRAALRVKAPVNPAGRGDAVVSRLTADWSWPPKASGSAGLLDQRKGTLRVLSDQAARPAAGRRWLNRRVAVTAVAGLAATGAAGAAIVADAAVPAFPEQRRRLPRSRLRHDRGLPEPHRRDGTRRGHPRRRGHRLRQGASSRRATSPSRSTTPAATAGAPARA